MTWLGFLRGLGLAVWGTATCCALLRLLGCCPEPLASAALFDGSQPSCAAEVPFLQSVSCRGLHVATQGRWARGWEIHSDSDEGDGSIKYTISGEGAGTIFLIDELTGDIHATERLDRERKTFYTLRAQARDRQTNRLLEPESEFVIKVQDINDSEPRFLGGPYIGSVAELSPIGTSVMQVMASDADDPSYGSSARVVYSVLEGERHFTVDSKTADRPVLVLRILWSSCAPGLFGGSYVWEGAGQPPSSVFQSCLGEHPDRDPEGPQSPFRSCGGSRDLQASLRGSGAGGGAVAFAVPQRAAKEEVGLGEKHVCHPLPPMDPSLAPGLFTFPSEAKTPCSLGALGCRCPTEVAGGGGALRRGPLGFRWSSAQGSLSGEGASPSPPEPPPDVGLHLRAAGGLWVQLRAPDTGKGAWAPGIARLGLSAVQGPLGGLERDPSLPPISRLPLCVCGGEESPPFPGPAAKPWAVPERAGLPWGPPAPSHSGAERISRHAPGRAFLGLELTGGPRGPPQLLPRLHGVPRANMGAATPSHKCAWEAPVRVGDSLGSAPPSPALLPERFL
ncbi:cadherin-22-like [Crotalus adamanteus]|uniref:Cadherin-22-like n=1 Tax=Crotalus adamanteus TaxID=8729 RepID=A0AAW1BSB9_CROAD